MNIHPSLFALSLASVTACAPHAIKSDHPETSMNTTAVSIQQQMPTPPMQAMDIIAFWQGAGPAMWFAKDAEFDRRFRERYFTWYEAAARGELTEWTHTATGTLALLLLLDQYPRNSFRGTPRMYDTDALALQIANAGIAAGHDRLVSRELQVFFNLPFAHSENLLDQERSVALARRLGPDDLAHAEHHRDIVKRFGRFPHRNAILGRTSTAEEQAYLDNGGYKG